METIVLAGGFGSRLNSHLMGNPKPIVDINGKPFLYYLFNYLKKNNVKKIILSVFYKYEKIINLFGHDYEGIDIVYSIDPSPLGTGGALKNAVKHVNSKNAIIVNGDTYYDIDLNKLFKKHINNQNDITMAVKPMKNFTRYGSVDIDSDNNVIKFMKKKKQVFGYIDGGIMCINKNIFRDYNKKKFSFNDFISSNLIAFGVKAIKFDNSFIDIGTPDDYNKAKQILINNDRN